MYRIMRWWLSAWLYVMFGAAASWSTLMVVEWQDWSWLLRLQVCGVVVLVLHAFEEWRFPGGFHFIYNLMKGSDRPDRYPMSQVTDMLSIVLGVVIGSVAIGLAGASNPVAIVIFFVAAVECVLHLVLGFTTLRRYRALGKRTIYAPGSATAAVLWLPLAVGLVAVFVVESRPTLIDWAIGILATVLLLVISIALPEIVFKNRDSAFPYVGEGYFEKFSAVKEAAAEPGVTRSGARAP